MCVIFDRLQPCVHVCMNIYIYTCTHILYMCMYIYTNIYMYVYYMGDICVRLQRCGSQPRATNSFGNTLQHTATHCNTHCNTHTTTRCIPIDGLRRRGYMPTAISPFATHCNTLQHNLQHVLQHFRLSPTTWIHANVD